SDDRVLEVATGPGYVALAFATVAREVVGVDLTDAPLAVARRNQADRGVTNVSFQSADAKALPWPDGSFDIVVCRLAFHHFESPARVLAEMVRVCCDGGKVAVEDMIASERPQERLERHGALGQRRRHAMLQRKLGFIGRVGRDPVAHIDRRLIGGDIDRGDGSGIDFAGQLQRRVDRRVGMAAGRPRLDRAEMHLPGRIGRAQHGVRVGVGAGPGEEALRPFEDRRWAGKALGGEFRRYHAGLGRASRMEMLAHGAGGEEFPKARRLSARIAQRMHGLVVVEPKQRRGRHGR
ncbi:MAG TPA: class I SAM-dependent methyltransferase, partial [Acidobacteria bacterium]|nr:class I SAM-dependent methyltransferase [Acidobacteriota bacterium]